jgi:hypothetical protein
LESPVSLRPYTWRQAIHKSGLPPTTRLVLLAIAFHVNDAGQAACISTAQLADETGLSERAVISHLKAIEGKWVVTRRHGYSGQQWARNEYLPRLPGDPSLDVEGTERPSVPPAEIVGKGTERPSVPSVPKGTERHDKKALNVVQGDNGFVLKHYPPKPPTSRDLLGDPEADLATWFGSAFWPAYPLHKAKANAWRAMRRLKPDIALRCAILDGLQRWLEDRRRAADRGEFVPSYPHAASWLNGRRWEDEASPRDVPREIPRADYRCAECGEAGVVSKGKRWFCRSHDPMRASPA